MEPSVESLADELTPLEQLVVGNRKPAADDPVLEAARGRAAVLYAELEKSAGAGLLAVTYVADLLGRLWLERRWTADRIDRLVRKVSEITGIAGEAARMSIFLRLIRDHHLFELPPRLAIEAQLQMLAAFGPFTEPSLWVLSSTSGKLTCALSLADGTPGRRARAAAMESIAKNELTTSERALIQAAPIRRWDRPRGAIVGKRAAEARPDVLAYLSEAALAVGPFLEIDSLLERNAAHERSLVESSERRLVRLGFDLHDGPMQDIAALAQDIRFFRSQLGPYLDGSSQADLLVGRVDDLEARLITLDRDLRDVARSLDAPALSRMPFGDALDHTIADFQRKSGLDVRRTTSGDFSAMTSSQRIALLRIIQEALNNVHDHSRAKWARVRVTAGQASLSAEVYDEGNGFDVEERLVEAAKAGRLGLVGMSERIRLLGGKLEIDSRPGGPTRIFARIPRWQPLASS